MGIEEEITTLLTTLAQHHWRVCGRLAKDRLLYFAPIGNKSPVCALYCQPEPNVMIQNLQDYLWSAKFIWVDKIALLAGILISLLLLFLWSLAFFVVGSLGAKHMWGSFGIRGVGLAVLVVGTIWLVMRVSNLLAGWFSYRLFPAMRRRRQLALPIPAPI